MEKFLNTNKLYDITNYYALYIYGNIKIVIDNNKKFKFYEVNLSIEEYNDINEWITNNDKLLKNYNICFDEISNIDPIIDGNYTKLININLILTLINNKIYNTYISNKMFEIMSENYSNNRLQYIQLFEVKNKHKEELIKLDQYIENLVYEL
ncbi:unknown similar to AMEV206 [Adoxophyes honmai entomopoxvirus 'L']|uniref:Uncharacterized protein n=1 Tax=Adoxophyes honmai entomopoxvirus 'L' TaxID=1293540 RepID=A0A916KP83_9POXV|nr:unknown similar to AMEV206 [Adoxophyes honmai entomopoxvirus 'L']CCU55462.1 unknown similar to AMEV206 [Adoxophyes honmai entomopoxvirus 'L']